MALCAVMAAGLGSCIEDKGNYDYDYVQPLRMEILEAANLPATAFGVLETYNNRLLELTPVFYDTETKEQVDVPFDQYNFSWHILRDGNDDTSQRIFLSDKPTFDAIINQPTGKVHRLWVMARHKETDQTYVGSIKIKLVDKYIRAYFFLTEDAERNVDMDVYGIAPDEEVLLKNYLTGAGYSFGLGGGANAILYDDWSGSNRIVFATGESVSWLDGQSFAWNELNRIGSLLPSNPDGDKTFRNLFRAGYQAGTNSRCFMYFGEKGSVYLSSENAIARSNIGYVDGRRVEIAPMAGAFTMGGSSVLWSVTNRKLVWASIYVASNFVPSTSCTVIDDKIGKPLSDCLFLGGSMDRPMTAVVKDADGGYWRLDMNNYQTGAGSASYRAAVLRDGSPRRLVGTEALGNITHWVNADLRGYLYVIVDNRDMYTYVESQTGGADPGWTKVSLTDGDWLDSAVPVTITDPVSFVHFENDNRHYMYIFTYSEANGGTLYMVRPRPQDGSSNLQLMGKVTGLGNAKKMCSWWS